MPSVASVSGVTSSAGSHGKSRFSATICGGVPAPGALVGMGPPRSVPRSALGELRAGTGGQWVGSTETGRRPELSSVPAPGWWHSDPAGVRGPKSTALPRAACGRGAVGRARGHAPFPLAGSRPRPWLVVGTDQRARGKGRRKKGAGGRWPVAHGGDTSEHVLSSHGSCRGPAGAASRLCPGNAAGNCPGHF